MLLDNGHTGRRPYWSMAIPVNNPLSVPPCVPHNRNLSLEIVWRPMCGQTLVKHRFDRACSLNCIGVLQPDFGWVTAGRQLDSFAAPCAVKNWSNTGLTWRRLGGSRPVGAMGMTPCAQAICCTAIRQAVPARLSLPPHPTPPLSLTPHAQKGRPRSSGQGRIDHSV